MGVRAQTEVSACYPTQVAAVGVQTSPHGVALNLALKRLYVANYDSDTLSVINSSTYAVIKTVSAGDGPNGVAYNSANGYIYVADRNTNKVRVLRASDYAFIKDISVGTWPNGIVANNVTNKIYVANWGSGTVSIINGSTNLVEKTVTVGAEPANIAIDTGLNKAFVTLHGLGRIAAISSSGAVTSIDIYSAGPYGITVDTLRNLVYVATIESFRVVAIDGISDTYLGWVEIRKKDDGTPVPLRQIAVNPSIGSSGHVFVTTIGEDGGFDMFLMMAKGWPDFFERPVALGLDEGREGMVFEPSTLRVFATSLSGNLLKAFLDGEPRCPYNFSEDYQLTICVANPDGACEQTITR